MAIGNDPVLEFFASSLRQETERELLRCEDVGESQGVEVPVLSSADPILADFCAELRASTEYQLRRAVAQVPELDHRARRRRRWVPMTGIAATAAMVIVLVMVDLPSLVQNGRSLSTQVASMAPWNKEESTESGGMASVHRRSTRKVTSPAVGPSNAVSTGMGTENRVLEEPVTKIDEAPIPERAATDLAPKKLSDDVLMRQAHRYWKQGKIKRAQRIFRRVAYHSSDRDIAQSAFADLFSIGRQLGGRSVLVQEWNRYLKKFPMGRYAQDALAGRCLAKADTEQESACWKRYLGRFPRGVYARKAKKSMDKLR